MQSPQHRQTWDLIPWLVNGTAAAADRALAEAHLAGCADCRDEYAFQARVQAGLAAETSATPAAGPAFERLLERIAGEQATDPAAMRPARQRRLLRALAAAVVVQAIGLAALATWAVHRSAEPAYRTLSTPETRLPDASLRFVPSPELNVGQLQRLLREHGLHVVGTNEAGTIYTLAPVAAGSTAPDVVARLRAAPGVLLVEPIANASKR
ncbi:MAG: zf-HC2 domain-containing protein [Dokdonella sp.]|uniref:zf-HC2 domain-containing protein n=1 Tax=Dokdonella sp. TaxID=2291710 RepID=UPI003F7CD540